MHLREHPLMAYRGCPVWPPDWVRSAWAKTGENIRHGEFGRLKGVAYDPHRPGRILVTVQDEDAEFIGCLVFDNASFCGRLAQHMVRYYGARVEEIGSSDISPEFESPVSDAEESVKRETYRDTKFIGKVSNQGERSFGM